MGFCVYSMFCCALLCVLSSFAIILMGKRQLVVVLCLPVVLSCADTQSFVRGGPTLTGFFRFVLFCFILVDEGREDPNTT